jgi:hypothetical protein
MREVTSVDEMVDAIITTRESAVYHRTEVPYSLARDRTVLFIAPRDAHEIQQVARAKAIGELADFARKLSDQGKCQLMQKRESTFDRYGRETVTVFYLVRPAP